MGRHEQGLFWRRWQSSRPGSGVNTPKNEQQVDKPENPDKVSLRQRFKHFTWAWFTFPMSTGGIALLLNATPHRFSGLTTIGKIVFIFDIVIYLCLVGGITARFLMNPGTLRRSLVHPTEALFFPTSLLATVTIFAAAQEYGHSQTGPWLETTMRILFWIYSAVTFLIAVIQYTYLFTAPPTRLTIQSMTPGWILPIFPIMLSGTLASICAPYQSTAQRMPMLLAGVTFQGLGWMVAFMVYAMYLHRLMQFGLPAPDLRPGMFIAVGPPSFTGLALIGISQALPEDAWYFVGKPGIFVVLQTVADLVAVFLWCLSFWFFCIAVIAVGMGARKMSFHLVWWAFIFPNTGFTLATIRIGRRFESEGILWVASGMTILLVVMWLFVLVSHVRAVLLKQIMMPGMDEDRDAYKDNDRKHGIAVPPDTHPQH